MPTKQPVDPVRTGLEVREEFNQSPDSSLIGSPQPWARTRAELGKEQLAIPGCSVLYVYFHPERSVFMYLSKALCLICAWEWVEMFTQPESLVARLSVIQFL